MKKGFLSVLLVLGLGLTGLAADGNPPLNDAVLSSAKMLHEKLLLEPKGTRVVMLVVTNQFNAPDDYAKKTISLVEPILRGDGSINVLNSDVARASIGGLKPSAYLIDEEAKKFFSAIPADVFILAKIDEEDGRLRIGVFSEKGDGKWSSDEEDGTEIKFEKDSEFYRLLYGFERPYPPRVSTEAYTAEILDLTYSRHDGSLLVADASGTVSQYPAKGQKIVIKDRGAKVSAVAFGPANQAIIAGATGIQEISGNTPRVISSVSTVSMVTTSFGSIVAAIKAGISVLDFKSGKEILKLKNVAGAKKIALSVDELYIYGIDSNGLKKWSLLSGECIASVSGSFSALAVDPKDTYIAVAKGNTSVIEEYDTNLNLQSNIKFNPSNTGNAPITSLSTSPSGHYLASGDSQGTLRIWLAARGLEIHVIASHHADINAIAFNPTSSNFASGGNDSLVSFYDTYPEPSGRVIFDNRISKPALIRLDQTQVSVPAGKNLTMTVPMGNHIAQILTPSGNVLDYSSSLTFSIEQHATRTITINPSYGGILDAQERGRLEPLALSVLNGAAYVAYAGGIPIHTGGRKAPYLEWNQNGNLTEIGSREQSHRSNVNAAAMSSDGVSVTGSDDFTMKVWKNNTLMGTVRHGSKVLSVDINQTKLLSSGIDETKLWDRSTLSLIRTVEGGKSIFHNDGSIFIVKGDALYRISDQGINLPVFPMETASNEMIFAEGIKSLQRGENGAIFVILKNGQIQVRNRPILLNLTGTCVAQNKNVIAVGKDNGMIELRDARTGLLIRTLTGHDEKAVTGIAFLNENKLASIGRDYSLRITDITGNNVVRCFRYNDDQNLAIINDSRFSGDTYPLLLRRGNQFQTIESDQVGYYRVK